MATPYNKNVVRYKLYLPPDLYDEMKKLADENERSVSELMQEGIKLRLLLGKAESRGGEMSLIRQKGDDPVKITL